MWGTTSVSFVDGFPSRGRSVASQTGSRFSYDNYDVHSRSDGRLDRSRSMSANPPIRLQVFLMPGHVFIVNVRGMLRVIAGDIVDVAWCVGQMYIEI